MTTSNEQAYFRLVLLMADQGLPAPASMWAADYSAGVQLKSSKDFYAWAEAVNAAVMPPIRDTCGSIRYTADAAPWTGWILRLDAVEDPNTGRLDLTAVRALAQ